MGPRSTYYNYSNGLNGYSNQIANFAYYNFSNGLTGTSSRVGPFAYYNFFGY